MTTLGRRCMQSSWQVANKTTPWHASAQCLPLKWVSSGGAAPVSGISGAASSRLGLPLRAGRHAGANAQLIDVPISNCIRSGINKMCAPRPEPGPEVIPASSCLLLCPALTDKQAAVGSLAPCSAQRVLRPADGRPPADMC